MALGTIFEKIIENGTDGIIDLLKADTDLSGIKKWHFGKPPMFTIFPSIYVTYNGRRLFSATVGNKVYILTFEIGVVHRHRNEVDCAKSVYGILEEISKILDANPSIGNQVIAAKVPTEHEVVHDVSEDYAQIVARVLFLARKRME